MITYIDTSALFSSLNAAEPHHQWSKDQIEAGKAQGALLIVDIVYCELSYGMNSRSDVDKLVAELALERAPQDDDALFKASKAFKSYREKNKGTKTRVLPDFLIGAFAETANAPLITTNAGDFKTYFPALTILSPQ